MKKALLLAAALIFVAGAAFAAPMGYMGLYTDEHTTCEVFNTAGFQPFEMWIWCLPSDNGQMCAEFMIQYPAAGFITSTVTPNDAIISVTLGDLATGMSVCYNECQYDWNWPFHQAMYTTDTNPSFIEIVAHPDAGVYQFANCLEGFPTEPILLLNHLAVNQPCVIGTEDASWGAIKGMLE